MIEKKRIDDAGRIVVSKNLREAIGIYGESEVEMKVKNDEIVISNPNKTGLKKQIEESIKECQKTLNENKDMLPEVKKYFETKIEAYNDILKKM